MLIWKLHVVFHSHSDSHVRTAHMHEETLRRRRLQDAFVVRDACDDTDRLNVLLDRWAKKIKSPKECAKSQMHKYIRCTKNILKSKTKIYFAGERTVWQPWTACRRCVFPLGPLSPSSSCSSSLTQCRWPLFLSFPVLVSFCLFTFHSLPLIGFLLPNVICEASSFI